MEQNRILLVCGDTENLKEISFVVLGIYRVLKYWNYVVF
jgi:hypothetical protein